LTVQERADHIAEWVRLTDVSSAQVAPVKSRRTDGRGGPVGDGINAATRELGIDRTEAQRAVKIAGITPEARAAADTAGLTSQTDRLEIAKAGKEHQAAKVAATSALVKKPLLPHRLHLPRPKISCAA
jgi:ParB family chromosome partitioning protein